MKRLLAAGVIGVVLAAGLFAGGTKEAAEGQPRNFKMGLVAGTASIEYEAASFFADRLEVLSEGAMTVSLFPGSQLGDDRAMLEQVSAGVLDFTFGETGRMGLWVPYAEIFQYPFVFDSFDHLLASLETPFGQKMNDDFRERGWRLLANAYNGTRQTSSNRAINSVADMRNLKLRVPNAKANMAFARNSGAAPTPMAFGEVYLALRTNAVDGQENPLPAIYAMKFYEVQSHIALTGHIINDQNYIISESLWQTLSGAEQEILRQAAQEAADLHTRRFVEQEEGLLAYFQEQGLTITRPDREGFRSANMPLIDEYEKEYGSAAMEAINSVRP
ncbi:sialic acid-binding protein [Alkalispirochaeta sphaeroplastigenens]|uniref:Sialic acid-binding protein n=1 Tax=Alkalispirochaeta sphaeroplastigenens TaxID=1187066 RepID=A0A2S4JKE3_9SPIO|nr:sialic acid TRAP transporter substrate-binding protein SiaP [Alkalispirochaeta sphaeroplastigenens]POR00008.1 sialic acid-binding protein [Alkalispirochaeta sphaeroplastigenens]